MGVSFESAVLTENTEVTGRSCWCCWVSSTTEDMDVFATLRNIAPNGEDVSSSASRASPFRSPKAGCARRTESSTPRSPYPIARTTRMKTAVLKADEVVRIDVEIWPTCMVFKKGHRIRLDVPAPRRRGQLSLYALRRRTTTREPM